jgi:hypothetical protein
MFKKILFVYFLFLPFFSFSQVYFDKLLGEEDHQFGISLKQISDSSIFLLGYESVDSILRMDVALWKFNPLGDLIWKKIYAPGDDDLGLYILNIDNQHLLLCGTSYNSNGQVSPFVIKVDVNGDTVWQRTFSFPSQALIKYADKTTDGGFVFSGQIVDEFGENNCFVFKTDSDGNLIWYKSIGDFQNQYFKQLITAESGGFWGIGDTYATNESMDILLLKLDENGNEVFRKQYGDEFENGSQGIIETNDGNLLIYGENKKSVNGKFDFIFLKINEFGDTIWRRNIGSKDADAAFYITENIDGTYTATGYSVSQENNPISVSAVKISATGELIWQRWYNESILGIGYEIIPAITGGYLIAATQYGNVKEKAELLYIDEEGLMISKEIDDKSNLTFYPNPFARFLTIQSNVYDKDRLIGVYSIEGKFIKKIELATQQNIIDLQNLENGIYFFRIISGESISFLKAIKKN